MFGALPFGTSSPTGRVDFGLWVFGVTSALLLASGGVLAMVRLNDPRIRLVPAASIVAASIRKRCA